MKIPLYSPQRDLPTQPESNTGVKQTGDCQGVNENIPHSTGPQKKWASEKVRSPNQIWIWNGELDFFKNKIETVTHKEARVVVFYKLCLTK